MKGQRVSGKPRGKFEMAANASFRILTSNPEKARRKIVLYYFSLRVS